MIAQTVIAKAVIAKAVIAAPAAIITRQKN